MNQRSSLLGETQARWQRWALAIVVLGSLATVIYAVVENFWG